MDNPTRNMSDTALRVANYRAMQGGRSDALLNDPFARRPGGERGTDLRMSGIMPVQAD